MIARLIIPLILGIVLPQIYHHWLTKRGSKSKRIQLLYWLPSLFMLLFTICMAVQRTFAPVNVFWLRLYTALLFIIVVPPFLWMLVSLFGLAVKRLTGWHTMRLFNAIGVALGVLFVAAFFYGSYYGIRPLKVRHITLEFRDLPEAFDGYRIVQFSDAHVGTFDTDFRRALLQRDVDSINAQKADLIVFTGDLQNIVPQEIPPVAHILRKITAPDGIVSVLGNHDYSFYFKGTDAQNKANELATQNHERQLGWKLLMNQNLKIHRGNDSIVIAGSENDGAGHYPQRADLPKTLANTASDAFIILLQHTPKAWETDILPHSHAQLTLSGHTHGGQMSLFGLRPTQLGGPDFGLYEKNGRYLHVTCGMGALMPFRLNMPAEIVVITLKKKV